MLMLMLMLKLVIMIMIITLTTTLNLTIYITLTMHMRTGNVKHVGWNGLISTVMQGLRQVFSPRRSAVL